VAVQAAAVAVAGGFQTQLAFVSRGPLELAVKVMQVETVIFQQVKHKLLVAVVAELAVLELTQHMLQVAMAVHQLLILVLLEQAEVEALATLLMVQVEAVVLVMVEQ
jgi:hypothetical protein